MKNITETLGIGSVAPDFSLRPVNTSEMFSLSTATARGPVVLEFLRGTWCPNCRRRMSELAKLQTAVWQAGGTLVSIAAEKREGMWEPEKYLRENPLPFPFLLDESRTVVKAYGVYHRIGIDAWDIAHPATLVVDRKGRIRYIFKGESQGERAPAEDVLKALEKAKGTTASI